MSNQNQGKKWKVSRQNWKPGKLLRFLRGAWNGIYSVLKIAVGAAVTVICICGVCLLVFCGILGDYLENDVLPNAESELNKDLANQNSMAYYVDSAGNIQPLQKIYADVDQQWASYEEIPKDLIHAAVAIEDKRFFEHQGVDWFTTIKACINMFVGSGSQFGGSSITQQLIKNNLHADDVTVQRKVLEIFRATELEKRYDKTQVMEHYLNIIFLGQRCNGVKAAAAEYFGKELEFLTPAECACLISITNNPSLYNPYRTSLDKEGKTGMEQNTIRRTNVLFEMRNQGYLTEEEYQAALNQEIVLKRGIDPEDKVADCPNEACGYHGKVSTFEKREDGKYYCPQCGELTAIGEDASQEVYSWFVDTMLEEVAQDLAEKEGVKWNELTNKEKREYISNNVAKRGYHIYTTLDYNVQQTVDKIYQNLEEIPKTSSMQQLQSGIVIIDNRTGDIVAMAGGVGKDKGFDDFNRAVDAKLQPGSSLKPLSVYAPGFELGVINPASVIKDMPLYYTETEGGYKRPFPYNDGRDFGYTRTVLGGLVSSVNAVAVNTLDTIGLGYSYNFAKEKFRISTLTNHYVNSQGTVFSDENYSPLAMGAPTIGVTIRDMTAAYATFANNGTYRSARTYTKVYDRNGELVLDNTQTTEKILNEKTINYINYCLDNAVDHGTGNVADLKNMGIDVCGKTGSTSNYKDRWFCGYTNYYTAAVWCGYDQPEVINLVGDGRNPAARLWKKVMEPLHQGKTSHAMFSTEDMVQVSVCLDCGKLATDHCLMDARTHNAGTGRTSIAYVYEEDAPLDDCDCHVIVDFCEECNAVANEYCKKLASVGRATITKRSLVQLTQREVDAIADASQCGLWATHTADNFVYLVDGNGNPVNAYKGIHGDQNGGVAAPYLVCTKHTKADWDNYLNQHPGYEDPDAPTKPDEPGKPTKPEDEEP